MASLTLSFLLFSDLPFVARINTGKGDAGSRSGKRDVDGLKDVLSEGASVLDSYVTMRL